jgi:hypothetical protein
MKQTIKVSADEAVNCIASGNRVFIQTAAASPQQLISVRTKTKQTKKKNRLEIFRQSLPCELFLYISLKFLIFRVSIGNVSQGATVEKRGDLPLAPGGRCRI